LLANRNITRLVASIVLSSVSWCSVALVELVIIASIPQRLKYGGNTAHLCSD